MPQDALCLYHTSSELNAELSGGKVSKITADTNRLLFYIYTIKGSFKLLIDTSGEYSRLHLTEFELTHTNANSNFCALLKKHLVGSKITNIATVGFERVIKIDFYLQGQFENQSFSLYAEIMGRYSNAFLTKDGIVLGAMKNAPANLNSKRAVFVNLPYSMPPPQDKISPLDVKKLENILKHESLSASYLLNNILGLSPFSANRLNDALKNSDDRLFSAQKFLFFAPSPCVLLLNGKPKDFFIRKTDGFEHMFFDSLSKAQDYFYSNTQAQRQRDAARDSHIQSIRKKLERCQKSISALNDSIYESQNYQNHKTFGDLILSNMHNIKANQTQLKTIDYDGREITIILNADISAAQNAQAYYKKYAKQKNTLLNSKKMLEPLLAEKKNLQKLLLEPEENFIKTKPFSQEKKVPKKFEKSFCRNYEIDGFNVMVGRDNLENDRLVKSGKPSDIWLHTKDYPSAHTLILSGKKQVPFGVIIKAAQICAFYSQASGGEKVIVDYCELRYVKKPKNSKAGFVIYTNNKSVDVAADKHAAHLI